MAHVLYSTTVSYSVVLSIHKCSLQYLEMPWKPFLKACLALSAITSEQLVSLESYLPSNSDRNALSFAHFVHKMIFRGSSLIINRSDYGNFCQL